MIEPRLATSCPTCGSADIRDKSRYKRSVRTLGGVETFGVTQHQCRNCKRTFVDKIKGVEYRAQIVDEVKRFAVDEYLDGPDLCGTKKVIGKIGTRISESTIWRAVQGCGMKVMEVLATARALQYLRELDSLKEKLRQSGMAQRSGVVLSVVPKRNIFRFLLRYRDWADRPTADDQFTW